MNRSSGVVFAFTLLSTLTHVAEVRAQEPVTIPIAEKSIWKVPETKIVSLGQFFDTMMKIEPASNGGKREVEGRVIQIQKQDQMATVDFALREQEFSQIIPEKNRTTLIIPMTDMGLPFTEGQKWLLYFDAKGEIARLQMNGTMTEYRKRKDGLVEVRVVDDEGLVMQAIPTTVMAPERDQRDGFYSNVDLFRGAGMIAGTDNVGGAGALELESLALLPIKVPRLNGIVADDTPWKPLLDGGMADAIELHQLFAY